MRQCASKARICTAGYICLGRMLVRTSLTSGGLLTKAEQAGGPLARAVSGSNTVILHIIKTVFAYYTRQCAVASGGRQDHPPAPARPAASQTTSSASPRSQDTGTDRLLGSCSPGPGTLLSGPVQCNVQRVHGLAVSIQCRVFGPQTAIKLGSDTFHLILGAAGPPGCGIS